MRATVTSLTKKFISTFFAATLVLGLIPVAAFADISDGVAGEEESTENVISSEVGGADAVEKSAPIEQNEAEGLTNSSGEAEAADGDTGGDDSTLAIPAADIINQEVPLEPIQPVAQQESSRSYFLAQTLEATRAIPIVSAYLPLDTGMTEEVVESATPSEGDGSSETEGDDDSDDSDNGGDFIDGAVSPGVVANDAVSHESTVVGSLTAGGITYAIEPGGESVALTAIDRNQLPEELVEAQTVALPNAVTFDGVDYYSVTRIADRAFADISDIAILGIPASITSIGEAAFEGFGSLECIVVEEGNPVYASYDGILYDVDLAEVRFVPEACAEVMWVAPSAIIVEPDVFSYSPAVKTVVVDRNSTAYAVLEEALGETPIELVSPDSYDGAYALTAFNFTDLAASTAPAIATSALSERTSLYADYTKSKEPKDAYYQWNSRTGRYAFNLPHETSSPAWNTDADCSTYVRIALRNGERATVTSYCDDVQVSGLIAGEHTYQNDLSDFRFYIDGKDWGNLCYRNRIDAWHCYNPSPGGNAPHATMVSLTLTRPGYHLLGFTVQPLMGEEYTIVGDASPRQLGGFEVITPIWEANTYSIRYNPNGASGDARVVSYTYGKKHVSAGDIFSRSNMKLAGWSTTPNGEVEIGKGVSFPDPTTEEGKIVDVYAVWATGDAYVITLDPNGGFGGLPAVYLRSDIGFFATKDTTSESHKLTKLYIPSRSGYTFCGYSVNPDNSEYSRYWDTGISMVGQPHSTGFPSLGAFHGDITLRACWEKKSLYELTLNDNGGSGGAGKIYQWTGKGWYTKEHVSADGKMPNDDTDDLWAVPLPKKPGYTFKGYKYTSGSTTAMLFPEAGKDAGDDIAFPAPSNTLLSTNGTAVAQWAPEVYTITLNANDGSGGTGKIYEWYSKGWSTSYPSEASSVNERAIVAPTRSGYKFKGYALESAPATPTYFTELDKIAPGSASPMPGNTEFRADTTLVAVWEPISYKITLDQQEGSGGTEFFYEVYDKNWYEADKFGHETDKIIAYVTAPTRVGYTFEGYYTEPNGEGEKILGTPASGDTLKRIMFDTLAKTTWPETTTETMLYAYWTNAVYTITLNPNGGSSGTTEICEWYGKDWYATSNPDEKTKAATSITIPSYPGHVFQGYATSANAETGKYWKKMGSTSDGIQISTDFPVATEFAGNTELYAIWAENPVIKITLDNRGGNGSSEIYEWYGTGWYNVSTPKPGQQPQDYLLWPEKSGCKFLGYSTDPDATEGEFWKTQSFMYGGYKAVGAPGNTEFTQDTTLFAIWQVDGLHTITLNLNDGEGGYSTVYEWYGVGWFTTPNPVGAEDSITYVEVPKKTGYIFNGFTTDWEGALHGVEGRYWQQTNTSEAADPSVPAVSTQMPSDTEFSTNATLYASWKPITYSVKYYDNSGTELITSSIGCKYGVEFNLLELSSVPTKYVGTGFKAKGWATQAKETEKSHDFGELIEKGTGLTIFDGSTVKLFLAKAPIEYDVNWEYGGSVDKNDGTPKVDETVPTPFETTIQMRDPGKKDGHDFAGWKASGGVTSLFAYDGVPENAPDSYTLLATSSVTFTAQWTKHEYEVTWNFNGPENKSLVTKKAHYQENVDMEDPGSYAGFSFKGWEEYEVKDDGSKKKTGNPTYPSTALYSMPAFNVEFIAVWAAHDKLAVSLTDGRLHTEGQKAWYWPGRGYVLDENTDDVNDVVQVGEQIAVPPSSEDYEFLGYFDLDSQNTNDDDRMMVDTDGNLTVYAGKLEENTIWYAHWKQVSCPVILKASYGDPAFEVTSEGEPTVIAHAEFDEPFSGSVPGGMITPPSRKGYTFMGYYTKPNAELSTADVTDENFAGDQWITEKGALVNAKWILHPTIDQGSVVLFAAWQLNDCIVHFDAETVRDETPGVAEVVDRGALKDRVWHCGDWVLEKLPVASSTTFMRSGCYFNGWYYLKGEAETPIFVSDAAGNPSSVLQPWNEDVSEITLYADWTPKVYTLKFNVNYPKIDGVTTEEPEPWEKEIAYGDTLPIDELSHDRFIFAGWYTDKVEGQSLKDVHMTDVHATGTQKLEGRFTPQGDLALQTEEPINLYAHWIEPDPCTYTLYVGEPGGSELISQSTYDYRYIEKVILDGSEAPVRSDGYQFAGWVQVDSAEEAEALVADGGPAADAETVSSFGPLQTGNLYFVAKWSSLELSVTLVNATEDEPAWLRSSDRLVDNKADDALSWCDACAQLSVPRYATARKLVYGVSQQAFTLPHVDRFGYTFKGWKRVGVPNAETVLDVVITPSEQAKNTDMLALQYAPVFEENTYTIVLDPNEGGLEEQRFTRKFTETFTFPYPSAVNTGACFSTWASSSQLVSARTKKFAQGDSVALAPGVDESGRPTFGLAELADGTTITLYAVWNSAYSVDVPLFANMAVDTETGDMLAGVSSLSLWGEAGDERYEVESLRYEPILDQYGRAAFTNSGTGEVYLSIYAGLSVGDSDQARNAEVRNAEVRELLRAENVGEGGAVSYANARGESVTASPLLIKLGGTTPLLLPKKAADGAASLEAATDRDAPYGFLPFGKDNPLEVLYGLVFEGVSPSDFAFRQGATDWTLPKANAANASASNDPTDPAYGREKYWSGEAAPIARLCYTVSMTA